MSADRIVSGHVVRRELRAMDSDITFVSCLPGAGRRLDRACRWLAAFEERFSRFRMLSELSRLNRSAGRPFHASPHLFQMVQLALTLAWRSGGLFDPTVLRNLEASGYDRSFDLIPTGGEEKPAAAAIHTSWRDVKVETTARTITLPAGAGIDLGGLGKGYAVDQLGSILGTPCLVNGGGDVFAAGNPPGEAAWRVGVSDPFDTERDLLVLAVVDRGIATSSTLKRSWRSGDAVLHHLIDPRTGRPSMSDAVQVTVVASSTLLADYHAKVALLLGAAGGIEYIDREPGVEGLIVRRDGGQVRSEGLAGYL